MKILLVGAEFFHEEGRKDGRTNGQTDKHDGANGRFCIFANATKMDINMEILAVTCRELFTK